MYGPTGIGVLYGKREWLNRLPPYQGGGEMIDHVSFHGTTFADIPFKFEAGTPTMSASPPSAKPSNSSIKSASTPSPPTSTTCSNTPPPA